MAKGVQIALGAGLVALLLGWYGWTQLESGAFVYYQTLEEFPARGTPGEAARVHGFVAAGSIERDLAARVVRFRVQGEPPHAGSDEAMGMTVVYGNLATPDLFQDGAEVVVEGRLSDAGDGTFVATNLLAKCPSKFEGEQGAQASL
jgi:cytochrome c-type biogenesis protein CcmE